MEKASAAEIAQHKTFAERLKLHANELEEDARDLGFELEGSASKPWIGYRTAAAVIKKCTKSLKSKEDVQTLKGVGVVIADLYVEFRDEGTFLGLYICVLR